jgi:PAS domain S-box-containing protein/putative nucleotidyltransferase with HDIG domain
VAQVSGYKPEAFYEDPALIRQIVHPEDRSLFDALRDGKLDPEEPLVLRWVRKDGRAIWTEQRNRVTYDEGGKRVALEGIVRDISERRQAEERLHLLSAGLEAAANGIVITDPGGIILWSNPAFTGLTGYRPEDVLGKDLRSLGSGGAMVEFYRQVWQTIQAGEVWHGEVLNYRKDGSTYNEEVTITPVFNNRNEISNFIAVKQDITDRKQDEVERARLYDELARAYDATIEGWSRALDLRDRETEGHTQRVTEMALRLSREMGFSDEALVQVRRGALLHDIGKMGIPDAILHKPGPLNDEEWQIMRRHPVYSYELIYPVEFLRPALDIPYYHHERWNGKGYPRQLKGEQIPLAARIFAAVDVWEALGADRPYRKAWPEQKVLEYLRAEAGEHFDPQVITVFLELLKRK